jgi:predicted unusual protein kinase regulating ubiquinone biosynthesis (AarF/ABC1/UbiB family)
MDALISARRWHNALLAPLGWPRRHVPLNHARIIDELLEVYGYQILRAGAFSGDPHGGNVLISRETHPPRLALVDFGQVSSYVSPSLTSDR